MSCAQDSETHFLSSSLRHNLSYPHLQINGIRIGGHVLKVEPVPDQRIKKRHILLKSSHSTQKIRSIPVPH
jgi:hypothetical protein